MSGLRAFLIGLLLFATQWHLRPDDGISTYGAVNAIATEASDATMPSKDLIKELREAFPDLLQADLESLFGSHAQTFAKIQIFAKEIGKREKFVMTSKNLRTFLSAKDLKTFARYVSSDEFQKRLDLMEGQNPILVSLAKKWIRNATLRVFADSMRSFLELIVNACDATVPDKAVGKFGMGFFSILSFLTRQETDGAIINIKTACRSNFETDDFFAYSMTFEKTGSDVKVWDDLEIRFKQLIGNDLNDFMHELKPGFREGSQMPTGTIVTIIPKNSQKSFSDATLNSLKNYVAYLAGYQWVPVFLNSDLEPINKSSLNPNAAIKFPINIFVLPNQLKVVDRGFGISLPVALSGLLIPASSTKTKSDTKTIHEPVKDMISPNFVNLPYKSDITQSHFLITVNGVVVVDKVISSQIKNENGRITDFKIEMPQSTRLTLARDEVLISEDGQSFEEAYLKNIINKAIVDVVQINNNSNYLLALFKGLSEWEKQTAASHIKGRFTRYLKQELQSQLQKNYNVVPIPEKYFDQLKPIFDYFAGVNITSYKLLRLDETLVDYNFSKFENLITELANNKISQADFAVQNLMRSAINYQLIRGMRVFFVKEEFMSTISTLGMQTLLFVPEKWLDNTDNITENIVATCTEFDLSSADKLDITNNRLIISTFADQPNYQINVDTPTNFKIFTKNLAEQFMHDFPLLLQAKDGEKEGILADSFILSLINKQLLTNLSCDQFLNSVLFSLLSKFGVTADNINNGNIYLTTTSGNIEQLWPIKNGSNQSLAQLFMTLVWYEVNTSGSTYLDQDATSMDVLSYFRRLLYRELTKFTSQPGYYKKMESSPEHGQIWGQAWDEKEKISSLISPFKSIGFELQDCEYVGQNHFRLVNTTMPIFVGRKDASFDSLQSEVQTMMEFIAPATIYDQTLKVACPNFSATNAFINLYLFKNYVEKLIKNENIRTKVSNLVESISGFYGQYCNIPENEFTKVYGSNEKISVLNPLPQVDYTMIAEVLNNISVDTKIFQRILQLQIDDFAKQTDVLQRADSIANKQIYIPLITSNTVLSQITKFFNDMGNVTLIRKLAVISHIIEVVQSPQDLMFVLQLLMSDNIFDILKNNLKDQSDKQFKSFVVKIKDLISHYIHEKIDAYTISDFYDKCRDERFMSLENRNKLVSDMPISDFVQEYLQSNADKLFLELTDYQKNIVKLVEVGKEFSLRRLMRAHFTGRGLSQALQKNDLQLVIKKVNLAKSPVDSWKITQAVEAGSERGAIEAASVECLQNSVDAIKSFYKNLAIRDDNTHDVDSIKFDLNIVPGQSMDNSHVMLTIQDFIGMPTLETLLADLVLPDYSKKTPADGNIGDMGNGTFKIYQAAKNVIITTRLTSDPSKIFVLQIIPHRNDDNMVDDLTLTCVEKEAEGVWKNFWGTKFEILFKENSNSETLVNIVAAKDFIKNCVGATNVEIPEQQHSINVYLKNEKINTSLKQSILYQHKVNGRILFNVYKRENSLLQSYITTGGVPFRALGQVAHEMALLPKNFISYINSGLIINLELGTYQPVQSRTRLNITDDIKRQFKECLFEVIYLYVLEQHKKDVNFLGSIFTNLNSHIGDFSQLKLNQSHQETLISSLNLFLDGKHTNEMMDKRLFFCFYKSIIARQNSKQTQKSFFEFINNEFENGLVKKITALRAQNQQPDEFETKLRDLFNAWKIQFLGAGYLPSGLIENTVVPWFEAKISGIKPLPVSKNIDLKIDPAKDKYKFSFTSYARNDIRSLLDAVLKAYSEVYFSLNKLNGNAPKASFKLCPSGEIGYYLPKSNEIVISPNRPMLLTNILKMVQALFNSKYQDVKNNAAYNLLFGVRRGVKSGTFVHELNHATSQTNDSYHEPDFEDVAKQRVIGIISDLFHSWISQIINISKQDQSSISALINKNIDKIEQIEKEDPVELFNLLNITA